MIKATNASPALIETYTSEFPVVNAVATRKPAAIKANTKAKNNTSFIIEENLRDYCFSLNTPPSHIDANLNLF